VRILFSDSATFGRWRAMLFSSRPGAGGAADDCEGRNERGGVGGGKTRTKIRGLISFGAG